MKKITHIFLIAAAFVLFSCAEGQIESPDGKNLVEKNLTFEAGFAASLSGGFDATKSGVSLDDQGTITKILWSKDDAINVFYDGESVSTTGKFTNTATESTEQTTFSGTISVVSGSDADDGVYPMFWAVYPYSENNTFADDSITFSVSAIQASGENTIADGQWPTMARSAGVKFAFYSICSGIRFRVTESTVSSVTFTNKDGGPINGTLTAGWDSDGKPEVGSITDGSDEITVTPPASDSDGYFDTDKWYFAVLAPVNMPQGIKVYYQAEGKHFEYSTENSLAFERNKFNICDKKDAGSYVDDPKVTYYRVGEIEAGNQYALYSEGFLLKSDGAAVSSQAVTISGSESDYSFELEPASQDAVLWTAGGSSSGYTFENDGYYVRYNSGTSGSYLSLDNGSVSNYFKWTVSDNLLKNVGSTSYYLYYSTYWSYWKAGTSETNTYFYSTTRSRSLSFAESSVSKKLGSGSFTNALSGAKTDDVTYSSSSESVAAVNATTGEVTLVGVGTTTIKAHADAADGWAEGNAEYTLTVTSATALSFTKVTSLSAGTYMIGSPDTNSPGICDFSNMSSSNDSFGQKTLTVTDGKISGEQTDLAGCIVEIEATSDSKWLIKYNDNYLKQNNTGDQPTVSFVASSSEASSLTFYASGDSFSLLDGSYEFYHSGSGACYKFYKSKKAYNLYFYKLDE